MNHSGFYMMKYFDAEADEHNVINSFSVIVNRDLPLKAKESFYNRSDCFSTTRLHRLYYYCTNASKVHSVSASEIHKYKICVTATENPTIEII